MAGTDSRFNATAFRDAIRFAMTMGLPETETDRATFIWDVDRTFTTGDSGGNPFLWETAAETTSNYDEVQIPVAVEFATNNLPQASTSVGQFDSPRITVTILDTDYDSIFQNGRRADKLRFRDTIYIIDYEAPTLGLFDVEVHQLFARAQDAA